MSLRSWIGKVIRLTDSGFWGQWYAGETWAGRSVTVENSLNLSAFWATVRLYAGVTGTLPLKFYERKNNDERVQLRDHAIATLIGSEPNADQHAQEFWAGMAACFVVNGNGYAEKRFLGERLVALDPMPFDTKPDRDHSRDRALEYKFSDRGKTEWLPREKVFHVRGFTLGRCDEGMSPLAAARQALSISLATEEAAGKTFSQGMRASGFFTGPALKQAQREDFTKKFIDPIIGNDAKAHYGILENGFDFKPINIPPKDAEMLMSRRFNVEEICRFMGTPPILVGHAGEGQTMWGSGVESIILAWLTLGLDSHLSCFEKAINRWLLTPAERVKYYAEFDRDALLRADSAARAEFISKMIQNAQMTPNEGRKKANRLPLPGGDVLLVNSTLVPLTQAGDRPARVQPAHGEPIPEPTP